MRRGVTGIEVIVVVAILGLATYFVAPQLLPGASKRAKTSTETTNGLIKAVDGQEAAAAASVTKIGEANQLAPDSPAKTFIGREVPLTLSYLRPPDPKALLEAEKRRVAVMEGNLEEARKLYTAAMEQSAKQAAKLELAIAAKRDSDLALEKAAAAEHARTVQFYAAAAVAVLLLGLYVYTRLYHVSPEVLGVMRAEMTKGKNPIQVITDNLAPRHYKRISKAAKLASALPDEPA